jgi:hypothetical protein
LERGDVASRYPDGGLVVAHLPSVHAGTTIKPRNHAAAGRVGVDTVGAVRWPFAPFRLSVFCPAPPNPDPGG